MISVILRLCSVFLALLLGYSVFSSASDRFIVVQSTTSTQNSGLFNHILPQFHKVSGIEVRIVAVGTGQAIRNASNGDGDVLLVHAKEAEEAFVVIVGPPSDSAGIAGFENVVDALEKIASNESIFVSRGDDSGTHKAERRLWLDTGVDITDASGSWYRETGSGMGATLNTGVEMGAYIMTDRATWIAFGNKGKYQIVVEGDKRLFNQYGITLVNPDKHGNVKAELGQKFIDWLLSQDGQSAIASYSIEGQQLFFPNAKLN